MRTIKVENQKGHEIVGEHLLQQIREGHLKPGQKLPSVVELAAAYGVGRSTIREAVSALKAMGWVDVRQGGGTYVKTVLPSEPRSGADLLFQGAESLIELLEVRKVLESGTASLAAERRTEQDLDRMREALSQMEHGLKVNDTGEGERADVAFHMAIAAASGNSLLIQLMESLSDRLTDTIQKSRELWFYKEQSTAARLLTEHQMIFDAIERQDKEQAGARIAAHLTKVEQVLRSGLESESGSLPE
ncbi:FadR/GntR family transcriptional regulator [Paenibacillus ihbetae]|uniref:GntR family transcriptional regulator n=1 Tax=Paenibacillus ihbetae TaxID=1870820 RepID=A0ABX3JQ83_9BACL|nr:FadR/GntR family transcriptional regulator [Paenibacillus ihbetae]OOC58590.1 GntR family transcriptional regulator [Paenibacillus ihbetae]